MRGEQAPHRAHEVLELLLPRALAGLADRKVGGEAVDHRREQLVLAREVRVQRGRAGAEPVGHGAHVHAVHAAFVEYREGGVDDRLGREPAARWLARAHPGRGREVA